MSHKIRRIEIDFPCDVEVTDGQFKRLHEVLTAICQYYESTHAGRVMWVFGTGAKMLVHPMMLSDDEPIPFDDSVLHFEISERAP